MKKILLAVAVCLLMAACWLEKDEKGYFLASNYCTATINGKEYIDRESYALPKVGHSPRAEWYEQYFWEDNVAVDSVGMLIVHTYLKPDKGNNNPEEYGLHLYIKDFRWDEPVEGQEYAFTAIALEETALFDVGGIGTIRYVPASGTIRFSLPEGAESNEDAGYWFEANITLRAEGNEPIDFRGYMYAYW